MKSNIKVYEIFGNEIAVRKFSPLHYAIEIGAPFAVLAMAIVGFTCLLFY